LWVSAATVLVEHIGGLRRAMRGLSSSQKTAYVAVIEATRGDMNMLCRALRNMSVAFPVLEVQLKEIEKMMEDVRQ
jgi:hypothetical protein